MERVGYAASRRRGAVSAPSLSSALSLVEQGLAVFPVSRERTPLIKGWPTKAATTREAVERLWHGFPHAPCVGVACERSDLVVIDRDPRNGGDDTWGRLLLEHGDDWLRSATVATPRGGEHVYLTARGRRFRSGTHALGPGVDVKAIGGYVVAPESTGEHGAYRWMDTYGIAERPLLPVPASLAAILPVSRRRGDCGEQGSWHRDEHQKDISSGVHPLLSLRQTQWTPERIKASDADRAFALAAAHWLGMPPNRELGQPFRCFLPGHADERPSASFGRSDGGFFYYHDFHARDPGLRLLTLAEVHHAQVTGRIAKLSGPLHSVWKMRLLYDLGLLDPVDVPLPPLPANAYAATRAVYEGFRLLVGLRWRVYPDREPVTFTYPFVMGWCSVSESSARRGVRMLVATGVIAKVGTVAFSGRTAPLFMPGEK